MRKPKLARAIPSTIPDTPVRMSLLFIRSPCDCRYYQSLIHAAAKRRLSVECKNQQLRVHLSATASACALASRQRDILFAVEHVRHRRTHAPAKARLDLENLFALIGGVSHQPPIRDHLEDQVPARRDRSAAASATGWGPPAFLLIHRIPGQ